MSININLLGEQFQEIMKQHSERMKRIAGPLLNLQKLPVFEELQKNMQDLSRLTEGVALKNQEAFERIADLNNHSGLKALSEQMELMNRELTAKLSTDLVNPVLKDLQSSLNGLEISEDRFLSALEKLEKRNFVEEFEKTVSNIEKGHSTAQGVSIGVSEVLAFLMFILMLIQTIDDSTEKELKELSERQELTNQLLQSLVGNTDRLINKSKDANLKLLIANEAAALRTQPDIHSDTLITLFKGQYLDLLKTKENWYKVQFYDFSDSETGIGWVQKKYIIPEAEIGQAQTIKLGEVAKLKNGFAFKSKSYSDEGIPVIRISDIKDNLVTSNEAKRVPMKSEYEEYKIEEGSILIAMSGATTGKFGIYKSNEVALQNQRVGKFVYDDSQITKKYLFYHLYELKRKILKEAYGGAQPNISSKKIEEMEIKLPPLPNQHRIVQKIEELFSDLDNGIENLKRARQQLETYKQSVLKAAFEGKLTAAWREQQDVLPTPEELKTQIEEERKHYREQQLKEWEQEVEEWKEQGEPGKKPRKPMKGRTFDPLDDELDSLPELPSNWDWIRISDTVSRVEYGTSKKSEDSGEVPVLRMGNMQGGKFIWDDLVYSNDPEEIEKYLLEPGDVLFNRTNSPELVGKTALYKGKQKAIFAGYLIRLNQIDTIVDARYLNYYLNSYEAQNYGNKVKTDGVNQSNINGTKLSGYPFPYTSLKEQKKIADEIEFRLSIVDQNKKTLDQELQKAEALRQSILKKAFEGKLIQ